MLVFISGISTSGKTTIGKHLVQKRNLIGENWVFKDLDDFYKAEKPKVKLSNGKEKSNWDCHEAIDYEKVNKWLEDHYTSDLAPNICFVGFALSKKHIKYTPALHFHLLLEEKDLAHNVAVYRQLSKKFKGADAQDDVLMVREVLIPFYNEIYANLADNVQYIRVLDSKNQRISIEGIGNYIECFFDICRLPKIK